MLSLQVRATPNRVSIRSRVTPSNNRSTSLARSIPERRLVDSILKGLPPPGAATPSRAARLQVATRHSKLWAIPSKASTPNTRQAAPLLGHNRRPLVAGRHLLEDTPIPSNGLDRCRSHRCLICHLAVRYQPKCSLPQCKVRCHKVKVRCRKVKVHLEAILVTSRASSRNCF